jgi:hypothetical protein
MEFGYRRQGKRARIAASFAMPGGETQTGSVAPGTRNGGSLNCEVHAARRTNQDTALKRNRYAVQAGRRK